MPANPHVACACCGPIFRQPRPVGRRGLLALAGGLAGTAFLGGRALAEDGSAYEAMLLTCIDPRFVVPVNGWMEKQGLKGQYSQFAIAGAAVGVVAPAFSAWAPAFWDNLGASIQLHKIRRVIVVGHRDCGAAAIAYGAASIATPAAETALHQQVYATFVAQLAQKQPSMKPSGALMALDGSVQTLG